MAGYGGEAERDKTKWLKARAGKIWQDAQPYRHELQEIYRYYMPFRQSTMQSVPDGGGRSEGQPIADVLFDATGPSAAFTFASTLQSDWMPPGEPFMAIEPGPLMPQGDARKALAEGLQRTTNVVTDVLGAVLPTVSHEMGFDLFAGTGAMNLLKGDGSMPIRARSVPTVELGLANGPWGDIWHIVWRRNWPACDLEEMWPNGKFSDALHRVMRSNSAPDQPVEVWQYTCFDARERAWLHRVWSKHCGDDAPFIDESRSRTKPWITPRFFVLPGETNGRGLGHLGLPFVKTANKTRELALTAAAFAVMGIFTRRNDGVFNPDTAVFEPLQFWNVSSNGGPLGPTISRLPVPQDFDVQSIVMKDEREQIRQVLMDDELPDEQLAVRSATEVAGRLRRHARRYGGVNARLGVEWVVATVQRAVDILEELNFLPELIAGSGRKTNITIDQLLTKVVVKAPAVTALRADRVEQATNYLQLVLMLLGPQAALLAAKVQELLPEMGRWMGVEERFLPSKTEQKQLLEMIASMVAQMQVQQAQAKAPPPQAGAPYVNGGGM